MKKRISIIVLLIAGIATVAVVLKTINSETAEVAEFTTEATEVTIAEVTTEENSEEPPAVSEPAPNVWGNSNSNYYNDHYDTQDDDNEYGWTWEEPAEDYTPPSPPSPPDEYVDPEPASEDSSQTQDSDINYESKSSESTTTATAEQPTTAQSAQATTEATTEANYDFMGTSASDNNTTVTEATPEPKPEQASLEQPADMSVWEDSTPTTEAPATEAPTTETPATEATENTDWLGGANHEPSTQESQDENLDWLGGANHEPSTTLTGDPDPETIE